MMNGCVEGLSLSGIGGGKKDGLYVEVRIVRVNIREDAPARVEEQQAATI